MKKSIIVVLTAIVVLLFSGLAICSALIPSNGSLSSNESQPSNIISLSSPVTALDAPLPPPPDGGPYSPEQYPTLTPTPTPISTSKPLEGQPSTPPQPSTGQTAIGDSVSNLPPPSGMTSISEGEVAKIGGAIPRKLKMISGSELWVLYNGAWTKNSAAIYYGAQTYILLYNDQGQGISTEETYPNGWVDPRYWGYLNSGYKYYTFIGDAVGWHKIVAKGSITGSSNVIWIYVWPTGPTPTPTWPPWPTPTPTWPPWPTPTPTWPPWPTPTPTPFTVSAAWPSSYTYYIGSPTYIYFTVNKPCYARVTYLKQNSNIVWSGPRYVSAGTHTDTGTIGSPRGMRTVVVDAWTSSGEYDSAVTSYNVV
uniref:Uncharacterized protein n=1 Tax=Candidatus Methanophaga sp. ANME-1 ERB7 TaxID=2759913 RepID=A0A7G9Z6S2_9EURY|nr:hypothetical protein AGOHDPGA_00013 [Methanosarcinales archaeon ANME-1 ERB7]